MFLMHLSFNLQHIVINFIDFMTSRCMGQHAQCELTRIKKVLDYLIQQHNKKSADKVHGLMMVSGILGLDLTGIRGKEMRWVSCVR